MKKLVLFIILCNFFIAGKTQSVEGYWYGTGTVVSTANSNNYLTELVLKQKGNKVTGTLNFYFRDSLFSKKVEGIYNNSNTQLTFKAIPIIFYKSVNTELGVDCSMLGSFQLITARAGSFLNGSLDADESHKYTCPSIHFKLYKSTDTIPLKKEAEVDVEAVIEKKLPTIDTTKKRIKNLIQTILVNNSEVNLSFYDNGVIDNDSVSIYADEHLVKAKAMLSYTPIKVTIKIPEGKKDYVDVSMFAENVGTEPPNSAVLVLYDGKIRHEIQLASDLKTTATVRIKRKKN